MVNMAGVALSALERVCVCLQTVTPVNNDAWTGLSQGALTAALAVQSARRRLRTQLSVLFLSPCPECPCTCPTGDQFSQPIKFSIN